ncbi:TRADD-N-associated membrane domain-containing protein [Streptomyces sp. NPDC004069]
MNSERRTGKRSRSFIKYWVVAAGGIVLTAGLMVWGDGPSPASYFGLSTWSIPLPVRLFVAGGILGAGAVFLVGVWHFEADDSLARLRDAEQGLAEALRTAPPLYGVSVPIPSPAAPGDSAAPVSADHNLTLAALWTLTHEQLHVYHGIATRQARWSFWSAQLAMAVGFGMLGLFVWVAVHADTTAGAVVAGGLGAVSAALAGFINRTFVKSQESAAGHLRAYFDEPLEFSKYLAAERLIGMAPLSPQRQAEIIAALAQTIVAGSGTGVSQDTVANPNAGGASTSPSE